MGVGRPTAETKERPPSPICNGELFEIDGSLRSGLQALGGLLGGWVVFFFLFFGGYDSTVFLKGWLGVGRC